MGKARHPTSKAITYDGIYHVVQQFGRNFPPSFDQEQVINLMLDHKTGCKGTNRGGQPKSCLCSCFWTAFVEESI